MSLNVIELNGERILPICFYGKNRNSEVLEYHQKVTRFLNFPVNYVEWPFHMAGHGDAIQNIVNSVGKRVDYYLFVDMDAIPLRSNFLTDIYNKVRDKKTIFGPAWTSNHKSPDHIHAACCFLCFSSDLYFKSGRPALHDRIARSDNGEELSWIAAEHGENISLVYPSDYYALTDQEHVESGNPIHWNLGNKFKYGLGTTYSDIFFHAGMQSLPRSAEVFIRKCKEILGEYIEPRKEAVIVSVNFSDFLGITLPRNKEHFDSIVVVTTPEDHLTYNVCEKNGVKCVKSDVFNKHGAKFNKGGAIRDAFKALRFKDWIVNLDADIILPKDFSEKFNLHKLDREKLYGSGRRFIYDYQSLLDLDGGKKSLSDFEYIDGSGCGFFQMWNARSETARKYGLNNLYTDCYNADQVDIDFLKKFCPLVEKDVNLVQTECEMIHLGQHGVYRDGRDSSISWTAN